jgi:hypothetical protein
MQDPIEDIVHDIVRLMFKLWRNLGTQPRSDAGRAPTR